MIEKWEKILDNEISVGTLLNNLVHTFDCISHGILIAKLYVCLIKIL